METNELYVICILFMHYAKVSNIYHSNKKNTCQSFPIYNICVTFYDTHMDLFSSTQKNTPAYNLFHFIK